MATNGIWLTRRAQLSHVVLEHGVVVVQLRDDRIDQQLGVVHEAVMLLLVAMEVERHQLKCVHKIEHCDDPLTFRR